MAIKFNGKNNPQSIIYNGKSCEKVVYNGNVVWETEDLNKVFYFRSNSDFSVQLIKKTDAPEISLEYSTDGTNWQTYTTSETSTTISQTGGNKIYFRGTGIKQFASGYTASKSNTFILTGTKIKCRGNIENLLDYQQVANGEHPTMSIYCFSCLFNNCSNLIEAPTLPATRLALYCYHNMFGSCSSLIKAPELPATTLTTGCYWNMFYGCKAFTQTPELPATIFKDYCYNSMFWNCSSLKVNENGTGTKIFTCPDLTDISYATTDMFGSTGGSFTGTPTANNTYYYY